jgi:hypothetical protein
MFLEVRPLNGWLGAIGVWFGGLGVGRQNKKAGFTPLFCLDIFFTYLDIVA